MLELLPKVAGRGARPRVLCLGAHADDLEIGCAGSLALLVRRFPGARVHWVVLSGQAERAEEARRAAADVLRGAVRPQVSVQAFRDGRFPADWSALKDFFETLKGKAPPDLIFTHHGADAHQDHRLVSELTWNTFRDHLILEYEIPKYDGDLGRPGFYVPLSAPLARRKVALLMRHFHSQRRRRWFTPETFMGLMRLRGVECNAPGGYAEAFYARKAILDLSAGR